jgi:microcystin-dependent protein
MESSDVSVSDAILATQYNNLRLDRLPLGSIVMFAGTTPPSNWLLCDGEEYNRVDYPDLFALIGVSFGDGDGSITFDLPYMQGFFACGNSATKSIGTSGGGSLTLSTTNLPSHTHTISNQVAHNHSFNTSVSSGSDRGFSMTGNLSGASNVSWSLNLPHNHTGITALTGSGTPINILPSYMAFYYIIKTIG